jgi:hypothetical protein
MAKSRFLVRFVDKDGVTSYLKGSTTERQLRWGILITYTEYQLTTDMNEALEYFDEGGATVKLAEIQANRPAWVEEFKSVDVYRKMGNREFITVNTRPFATVLALIKGYRLTASDERKNDILKKMFEDEKLYNACEYALTELKKLK